MTNLLTSDTLLMVLHVTMASGFPTGILNTHDKIEFIYLKSQFKNQFTF